MPTVTRPKPKLVSKHLSPPVAPVNAGQVKAHYVGKRSFVLLQWAPGVLLAVLILTLVSLTLAIMQRAHYASVGELACTLGRLPEPQINCADGDLDCLTNPTVVEVSRIKETIRDRNIQMAQACVRVL